MSLITVDFWVKSFDNTYLKCAKNLVNSPKATILILHGLGEHYRRYDYITRKFMANNFNVYRYDQRGHGDSDGKRGYVDNANTFVKDLKIVIDLVKEENPHLPIFILGQGMGGHIMSILGGQYDNLVDGMVFCSPLICDFGNYTTCNSDEYDSDFDFVSTGNIHNLSHDYDFIQSYDEDELVLKEVTVGIYHELKESCSHIVEYLYKFKYPCLILHGSMDSITDCEDSRFLFNNIISKDKEIRILKGLYHKLLEELIKDDIISEITRWIEKRI